MKKLLFVVLVLAFASMLICPPTAAAVCEDTQVTYLPADGMPVVLSEAPVLPPPVVEAWFGRPEELRPARCFASYFVTSQERPPPGLSDLRS